MKKSVLIKISGKVQNSVEQMELLIDEIKAISSVANVIFMHGGGVQITTYYEKLGLRPTFVNGLRKTDDEQMKVVEMVLSGTVNKNIVSNMLDHKIPAIGISGRDNLIFAKEKFIDGNSLGNVGEVTSVNREIIDKLFSAGFIPVISPVSNTVDYKALNVNADDAAEAVASALGVDYLVLFSDVSGIWDENKDVITTINEERANKLIENGVIVDGMAVKVKSSFNAIKNGIKNISINSVQKGALTELISSNGKKTGTTLVP